MEKTDRRQSRQRQLTLGLMCSISDGKSSYFGTVEDLSALGLRIGQLSLDFDETVQQCQAVIHGLIGDIDIIVTPRWSKETNPGFYQEIGFQIQDPPQSWMHFVERLTNETDQLRSLFVPTELGL